jgi:hypothetical protein
MYLVRVGKPDRNLQEAESMEKNIFRMLSQRGMTKPKPFNILPVIHFFGGKKHQHQEGHDALIEVKKIFRARVT